MKLPTSLSRNAIINTFRKVNAVAWEHLFDCEAENGLRKLRVEGDFKHKAYYSTEGLIHWLIRNDRYTIDEINRIEGGSSSPMMSVRTHVLAG